MKQSILIIILLALVICSGCAIGNMTVDEAQKGEVIIAKLINVPPPLTYNHWAGIAQADADIASEPVSIRHLNAITKWSDPASPEYKAGYLGISKAYYQGYKLEGAIKKFMKKLTDYGVMIP
jgi:hypothetical protein